jgi:hypothetical protein
MNRGNRTPVGIVNKIQFGIGLLSLCLGALVYLTLRSPDQVYFTNFFGIHHPLFDIHSQTLHLLGRHLPAFFHVFSFILITASFFGCSRKTYAAVCGAWFLAEALFELGQKYKAPAERMVFEFFDKIPFLESTRDFFLRGTFDVLDLAALAAGALAAYFVLLLTFRRD